jgi:hypothetical protein
MIAYLLTVMLSVSDETPGPCTWIPFAGRITKSHETRSRVSASVAIHLTIQKARQLRLHAQHLDARARIGVADSVRDLAAVQA